MHPISPVLAYVLRNTHGRRSVAGLVGIGIGIGHLDHAGHHRTSDDADAQVVGAGVSEQPVVGLGHREPAAFREHPVACSITT